MGVRGLLLFLFGAVLLYTCILSVAGHKDGPRDYGGQDYSGIAGYGRDAGNRGRGYGDGGRGYGLGGRSYGLGGRSYGYGRWWCTCRWWCRYREWRVRNTCAIPFFSYSMKTCCKWLPWYKTSSSGYENRYTIQNYGPEYGKPSYGSRPDYEEGGYAGYGVAGREKGV